MYTVHRFDINCGPRISGRDTAECHKERKIDQMSWISFHNIYHCAMLNEDLHHTDVHRPDLRFSRKLSSDILTIQAPGRCTRGTCSELFTTMDWSNIRSRSSISHLLLMWALCFWSTSQVHRELIIDLWRYLPFWDAKYGQLFNYVSSIISFISSQRIWSNEFEEDLTLVQQLCSPSKYKPPDL
jgi:hypothetical protein